MKGGGSNIGSGYGVLVGGSRGIEDGSGSASMSTGARKIGVDRREGHGGGVGGGCGHGRPSTRRNVGEVDTPAFNSS